MRFLVALLFIFSVPVHGEVTHTDVEQALKTVTSITQYPDQYRITRIGMEDPVGVLWNHKREICEVLVSAKHLLFPLALTTLEQLRFVMLFSLVDDIVR